MPESPGNIRGKWERLSDQPQTVQQMVAQAMVKGGPMALIAAALVYYLAGVLQGTVQRTYEELRDHARVTNFYQRQICINLSVQAGTPRELCDPPTDHR